MGYKFVLYFVQCNQIPDPFYILLFLACLCLSLFSGSSNVCEINRSSKQHVVEDQISPLPTSPLIVPSTSLSNSSWTKPVLVAVWLAIMAIVIQLYWKASPSGV